MTMQEYYRELEKMYITTDWKNLEAVKRYNQRARELRQLRAEEAEREQERKELESWRARK